MENALSHPRDPLKEAGRYYFHRLPSYKVDCLPSINAVLFEKSTIKNSSALYDKNVENV